VTYNVVTAATALMGHLSPLLAAILMPLSSAATLSLVALIFRTRTVRESSDGMEAVNVQTNLAS
jgi:Cu2+-exporting ATPase